VECQLLFLFQVSWERIGFILGIPLPKTTNNKLTSATSTLQTTTPNPLHLGLGEKTSSRLPRTSHHAPSQPIQDVRDAPSLVFPSRRLGFKLHAQSYRVSREHSEGIHYAGQGRRGVDPTPTYAREDVGESAKGESGGQSTET